MEPTVASSSSRRIVVASCRGQLGVLATVDFRAGESVVRITGRDVAVPTRYTLQVAHGVHVDAEPDPSRPQGYPDWRFCNHSCEPNVALRGRAFVALRAIASGEEITFDYDSTEWDMAAPFACECGSRRCRRTIRGYRHLLPAQRAAVDAAPHVRDLAAAAV
jgi:hypothetical protein